KRVRILPMSAHVEGERDETELGERTRPNPVAILTSSPAMCEKRAGNAGARLEKLSRHVASGDSDVNRANLQSALPRMRISSAVRRRDHPPDNKPGRRAAVPDNRHNARRSG